MGDTANINLTEIWDRYNQTRLTGDKRTANKILGDYIILLKKQEEKEIEEFVDKICTLTLEIDNKIISNNGTATAEKDTRIQHPLFKEIILPVLTRQYQKGSAKHIKWIGQLEQFFYTDHSTTVSFLKDLNISKYFYARDFFLKSFAIVPHQKTLVLLLNRIAKDINYCLHEVPTVVLATPEVLESELAIFREYLHQCDNKEIWADSLNEWEFIAKHWTAYHKAQEEFIDFEDYLSINGVRLVH